MGAGHNQAAVGAAEQVMAIYSFGSKIKAPAVGPVVIKAPEVGPFAMTVTVPTVIVTRHG
jgi:hypothetical protein